jgi:non-heme Fe2+,alpha-ketoglutarate-dependent halogenase
VCSSQALSAAVRAALTTLAPPVAADEDDATASASLEPHAAPLSLTDSFAERGAYLLDGLLLRRRILSPAEAAASYDNFRRYEVSHCGGRVSGDARFKAHLMLPWLWRLVHHPRLVALVAAALGTRHVACWSTGAHAACLCAAAEMHCITSLTHTLPLVACATDVFVKEPGDGALTTWHQDGTYAGMHPAEGLTAWLALTPSTSVGGAVRFLPGSHAAGQRPHVRGRGGAANMLLAGQEVADACDAARSVVAELAPGEASLHHLLTVHCSSANDGSARRVGIALRYMPAHVMQTRSPRDSVTVVSGDEAAFSDRYAIERAPASECDHAGRAAHAAAVAVVHPDAAQPEPRAR